MLRTILLVALATSIGCAQGEASSIVIAGSQLISPPPFQIGPHGPVAQTLDRAYQFNIVEGGPYRLTELQIAAYRTEGAGGANATFAIYSDANGVPGDPLTTFPVNGIPLSTPAVLSASPSSELILKSDTPYWIVGTTNQGQVNWSLALGTPPQIGVIGVYAFKLRNDDWVVNSSASIAAYAILGTPVPEPTSASLAVGAAILVSVGWRRL